MDTRGRFTELSFEEVKMYYSPKLDMEPSKRRLQKNSKDHTDKQVGRLVDHFILTRNHKGTDKWIDFDEFIVRTFKPNEERAEKPDFCKAKKTEVDGIVKKGSMDGT